MKQGREERRLVKHISTKTALLLLTVILSGCMTGDIKSPFSKKMSAQEARAIVEKAIEIDSLSEFAKPAPTAITPIEPNYFDPVSEAVAQMADQMILGLKQNRVKRLPVAVLPFKSLRHSVHDDLFGARISESFIFPMTQRGYNMVDYRAVSLVTTDKARVTKGTLPTLQQQYKIYYILTGTYAKHGDGVVLNARILDVITRQVVATGQSHIAYKRLESILPGYDPIDALNKGFIIENGIGPQ
ncbi:MAG: TolB-like protein [Oceanospirillaceae bacterium]|jgi:TolB-like protein